MGLFKEFKEFAVKGNAMDMAVGIIIGAAFGKVVTSLVTDVIMPPVGIMMGNVDFRDLKVELKPGIPAVIDQATKTVTTPEVAEVAIRYGLFLNTVIDFLIVAFTVFMMVKVLNMAREKAMLPWHKDKPAAEGEKKG